MQDRFTKKLWHTNRKEFIKEFSVLQTINSEGNFEHTYFERNSKTLKLERLSTCQIVELQCTGLKDKNGKLIYEGDIVKGKKDMICSPHSSKMVDKIGVIEIPNMMFVATCRDVKNNCTLFCQNDWEKTEVIGNIYENPELLEGKLTKDEIRKVIGNDRTE